MNTTNQLLQHQQQKQSGGYHFTPSKPRSRVSTSKDSNSASRPSTSRSRGKPHPFQNPEQLNKIMSLFQ